METTQPTAPARRIWLLVVGEAAAIALAVFLTVQLDLGWTGALVIAAVAALFTVLIVRSGERRARASGNCSAAMLRYNRRMLVASAVYVVGLFGAIWAHDQLHPTGLTALVIALAPSIGVLMMIVAMGRLVGEETDEYLRFRYVRGALFGLGTLLTLATIWGFFEQFDLMPHVPAWAAVPVFAIGMGVSNLVEWRRP